MSTAADVATRFAHALDVEDYPTAEALLGARCEYTIRGEIHRGPAAIIASYRDNGDAANRDFDGVEYESRVSGLSDDAAAIVFVDHLSHQNERFTFSCRQVVEIDGDGRIVRIEHVDVPGGREALAAFKRKVGLDG